MESIKLIRTFIRKSFQQELAFRFNFLVNSLNTLLSLAGGVGGVLILFSSRETVNGWSVWETLTLMGIYLVVQAVKNLVIGPSINALSGLGGELWTGSFDFTLLKPVPTQFYVSVRNWSLWSVLDLLIGLAILMAALFNLSASAGMPDIFLFLLSMLVSLGLVYAILLALGSAAFWYLGTPLLWIYDSFMQMARFPVGIYPGFLRLLLTWVLPVGFIVTVPAQALIGRLGWLELAGGGLLAVILFIGSSWFFRFSVRRYASASS